MSSALVRLRLSLYPGLAPEVRVLVLAHARQCCRGQHWPAGEGEHKTYLIPEWVAEERGAA